MDKTKDNTINLTVTDVSRQRRFAASVPVDAPVGVALADIVGQMDLPVNDQATSATWSARLDREARQLHSSEIVGDALVQDDTIVLQPEISAG